MRVKRDTKNPFCTSLDGLFLKDGKFDNNWVGKFVIKPVDTEQFQRIKYTKEGGKANNGFYMEIIEEGALEKALITEKKTPYERPPQKKYKR